ncbi:YczE/YyaS/YitT family protein [Bifidobacterium callitrichos]|uniref:Putative membrane protein n=1 Tax=Bifidobacterium callitrichos DSM 23973 TaxID=1437609 RepID=A0A086ZY33_9BIFI|nr:DUF6198 family protein [Bifidobacterium callitrichos]KFI51433.1 putative membrane protein [Bifidobacterium callitrichos DSM 23973]
MPYIIKRFLCFIAGISIESFGIALITKSALGTSPISSIAWVVALRFPQISFGVTIFAMNVIFVIIEVILLRRDFHAFQYLQLAVTFWFSAVLDVSMTILGWFDPDTWWMQGAGLLLGCFVLALGICMEVAPGIIMVPGEGIVHAFSVVTKVRFGTVKVYFDVSLIIIAGVLSFVFFHRLNGLGVGTVVVAVITGQIVNLLNRHFRFVPAIRKTQAVREA